MSIVRALGKPDLFITFTSNPNWIEIQRELNGTPAAERLDLCVRVFHIKLNLLLDDLITTYWAKLLVTFMSLNFKNEGYHTRIFC